MLKPQYRLLVPALLLLCAARLSAQGLYRDFKMPPAKFRPVPFWHLNGNLTTDEINKQVAATMKAGFGGVTILPVTAGRQHPTGLLSPGMSPVYLTGEYFARYADILKAVKANNGRVIFYDDVDFPSGTAGGKLKRLYPGATRKLLVKKDTLVNGGQQINLTLSAGALMAVVGTDLSNNKRIDLTPFAKDGKLLWQAPAGQWKIQTFTSQPNGEALVDYMDPDAVKKFIGLTYDEYYKRFGSYFATTIQQTFFDDVGYYSAERGWTDAFNAKFKQLYGKDPATYYPALWEDIGPETEAARVAFFDTRAELLAEGFPKIVTDWDNKHGLKSSGHPPGNYEIQPVDMNFDIFKFNRHQDIPTMDAIFYHGHGREGFKLVSSAAAVYDKPVVAAEIFGAFLEDKFTINTMYQAAMEVFVRGINQLVPHGMWYDYKPQSVRIPPLVSPYSDKIAPGLKKFNDFAARTSMVLTGGRQVAEIGVIYPIAALEGFYRFEAKGHVYGQMPPKGTDYLAISDLLTNNLHRDFSFIHPQLFTGAKYRVSQKQVVLNNKVNKQTYKVIILPAGKVISYPALKKLQTFYQQGGKVIATYLLPSKSAEFGMDAGVQSIVKQMFNVDGEQMPATITTNKNTSGGVAMFLPMADSVSLAQALTVMAPTPDVILENTLAANSQTGKLSYLHKIKGGKDIYYIANSTTNPVNTYINLKGKLDLEIWDPDTGKEVAIKQLLYLKINGAVYSRVKLNLAAVKSIFIISKGKP
ncbi:glycosyl hydrolase [Mucilaginibacter sp. UYCu711]|uniref:glycosyl hydrolase n=1 Tax=Mucilaginibacter sp. UYCu711 TaxID=3156339 RepID=UPI003D19A721